MDVSVFIVKNLPSPLRRYHFPHNHRRFLNISLRSTSVPHFFIDIYPQK